MKSDHNLLQGLSGEMTAGQPGPPEGGGRSGHVQVQPVMVPDTETELLGKLVYMEVVNLMYGFTTSLG